MNHEDSSSSGSLSRARASGSAGPSPADDATVISPAAADVSSSGSRPAPGAARSPTAEIGRLLEGTMLGPYRLDEFIGGGGMGAVFRALDTTLDRIVAVKVLARRESDDEETLRRFRNEAQSAARLDHENIGRVHAVGSEADWHFIVFEFIEGTNVRDLVREEGPFDPGRTIDVAIQVADALEHASEREIVHRDIKPSNIVITPAGRARIVDMGLARLHHVAGDAELTVSGMTLGTFDYISPEQARDPRAADVRSDLYSLGCTMFFMLAGRPPFAEGTMVQKLLQHQQAPPPAIDQLRPDVPRRLAAIIARLMEKDPLARYQRPAVLVADLLACAETEGIPVAVPRPTAAAAPEPQPASRLPWLLPALLLAALVGVLWVRSLADRRGSSVPTAVLPGNLGAAPKEVDPVTNRVVRTPDELVAAVAEVVDGGTVEIDRDGEFELPPLEIGRRRFTLRAAAGRQPVLLIKPAADGAGLRVTGGDLVLRGVVIRLLDPLPDDRLGDVRPSMFRLAGGRLTCEATVLRMPGSPRRQDPDRGPAAFVAVVGQAAVDAEIVMAGVRAAGDADLLVVAAPAGGRVGLRWDAGTLVTPRRLLLIEGSRSPTEVRGTLENVVAACGTGLVVTRDSGELPVPGRVTVSAAGCRFVLTDPGHAFLEQRGGGLPEEYAAAIDWRDRHGRYEGGAAFRRIDGAAERVEVPFDESALERVHEPTAGSLPEPAEWAGWGS